MPFGNVLPQKIAPTSTVTTPATNVGNVTATPPREGNGLDRFLRTHGAHGDRGAHAPHVPHDEAFLLRPVHELS